MTVILARNRHATGIAQAEVHAYLLDFDGDPPTTLHAICGHELVAADAEQVDRFTGMPCMMCVLAAFGRVNCAAEPPPDQTDPLASKPRAPLSTVGAGGLSAAKPGRFVYGVALRGDRASHLVAPEAVSGRLDNRSVVQTLCCHLAWGPSMKPVDGWPICGECTKIAQGTG
ncbi:hypothetical protein A8924_1263 [Saccharopolyspora erythraea NRRL 2338]|uniref:Uncharacterized protein n=2 Tax=Saccharopolyspora erythraea TaxID=1836 RepID=A4F826_SACEN|nr:hypothetical protein [Saccharopolyspora erythraea]EQD86095.1 hypothetical protein N599_11230 [Saccharopolyspora erythraea D]PFG93999.1 hypothetical protein A8924_1263 [Saccharopolyspora erythraea NRRL 2338]QRK90806.1 hypothetical protein JQX30_04855 [Saccharopolyspora erythraea]CAM00201.1 hypothetical protein SACE_0862 [Saccharopolyspora erythraea NRRL 2338]